MKLPAWRVCASCLAVVSIAVLVFATCGPPRVEFVTEKPKKKTLAIPEPFPVAYQVGVSKETGKTDSDIAGALLRAASSVLRKYFDKVNTVSAAPSARAVFDIESGKVLEEKSLKGFGKVTAVAVRVEMRGCEGQLVREATGQGRVDKSTGESKKALSKALVAATENAMDKILSGDLSWMSSLRTCRVGTPTSETVELPVASTGTGFYINEQGDIVTAQHVVSGCDKIGVVVDGIEHTVKVAFFDAKWDLALLRKGPKPAGVASLAPAELVERGKEVIAFGFPLQGLLAPTPSLTKGMLSNNEVVPGKSDLLQLSAPISEGNSGGPLIGIEGGIYGVTVSSLEARRAIAVFKDGTILVAEGSQPQNVNFAVGVSRLRSFLKGRAVPFVEHEGTEPSDPVTIGKRAKDYTVIVLCRDATTAAATPRP